MAVGTRSKSLQLELDESYRTYGPGKHAVVTVVGGYAFARSDLSRIENGVISLKRRLGLEPTDELKFNYAQSHPARIKTVRAGIDQRDRVPTMLEAISDLPVQFICHAEVSGIEERSHHRTTDYINAFREVTLRFSQLAEPVGRPDVHRVEIDSPPHDVGQSPTGRLP